MRLFGLTLFAIIGFLNSSCSTTTTQVARTEWNAFTGNMICENRGDRIATAVGGGMISTTFDEQDRKVMERSSPRTVDRMERGEPLTINDIIKLSQGGVNDSTIISYMSETLSSYTLSQAQVRRLRDAGVSQRVIDYMVDSGQ